jgi:atypical dual specificity phosphatase
MAQSILDHLWWVIPKKLAGVRKPTLEEIPMLKAAGVGAIVSVMDDQTNLEAYEQAKIPFLWLPAKGGTAPSHEQIQSLQQFVEEQHQGGYAVAVHCSSGRRRTGTILAAYLIQTGSTFETALQRILAANPEVELREAQVEFLQSLARPS